MPLIVPHPDHQSTALPGHVLRPLVVEQHIEAVDPDDGSVTLTYAPASIAGRIARGGAAEDTANGRQAGIGTARLFTNHGGISNRDRIVDPDEPGDPWELAGPLVAVRAAGRIHHYEAPIRRVNG